MKFKLNFEFKLRSSTIAHPQQQVVLTCYIPPSRVGAVIGRKGNTILHIQREAVKKSWSGGHVRVSVLSTLDSKGDDKNNENEDGENHHGDDRDGNYDDGNDHKNIGNKEQTLENMNEKKR